MKPIETRYAGRLFRSRLEARWAVFFDAMGIQWEYEPEGFHFTYDNRDVLYLPDFRLPSFDGGMYVEVKPVGGDLAKPYQFALASGWKVWLAEGEPGYRAFRVLFDGDGSNGPDWVWSIPLVSHAYDENRMYHDPEDVHPDGSLGSEWWADGWHDDRESYLAAVEAALSERFEPRRRGRHGFAPLADVLTEIRRGPRVGRALNEAEARQRSKARAEGDRTA